MMVHFPTDYLVDGLIWIAKYLIIILTIWFKPFIATVPITVQTGDLLPFIYSLKAILPTFGKCVFWTRFTSLM